jgi:hypothetical protein
VRLWYSRKEAHAEDEKKVGEDTAEKRLLDQLELVLLKRDNSDNELDGVSKPLQQ